MKKRFFLCMGMMLLALVGLASCNNDDDANPDVEPIDQLPTDMLLGHWQLILACDGWGNPTEFADEEVLLSFTFDGDLTVASSREDSPFQTGTYHYSFVEVDCSIIDHKPATAVLLSESSSIYYIMKFIDDKLILSANVFDGPSYTLQRRKGFTTFDN